MVCIPKVREIILRQEVSAVGGIIMSIYVSNLVYVKQLSMELRWNWQIFSAPVGDYEQKEKCGRG